MIRFDKYLIAILVSLFTLNSCYQEVDLDDYRNNGGEQLLTLNSLFCPDSTLKVSATRTYFFSDIHNERRYVEDLAIEVIVNGQKMGTMRYDEQEKLYVSDVKPKCGDTVAVSTMFNGQKVSASDVVPQRVKIENVTVERRGPLNVYTDRDFIISYGITFTDNPDEENYYFLQWDVVDRARDLDMGERDFTHEFVFMQLAHRVHATLPGWEPYCPYGLPFSDKGIEGQTHTLKVEEIVQMMSWYYDYDQMKRKLCLYAISKSYYDYLERVLINQTTDKGLQGGLIDIGIADPVKVYSNINGGIGIHGSYVEDAVVVDVLDILGPFPQ